MVAESDIHCVMVDDADEGVVLYTYPVNGYWLAAAIHLFVSIFVYYISCTNSSQKATKPEVKDDTRRSLIVLIVSGTISWVH